MKSDTRQRIRPRRLVIRKDPEAETRARAASAERLAPVKRALRQLSEVTNGDLEDLRDRLSEVQVDDQEFRGMALAELILQFRSAPRSHAVSADPPVTLTYSTIPSGAIRELERRIRRAQDQGPQEPNETFVELVNRALDLGGLRLEVMGATRMARLACNSRNKSIQLALPGRENRGFRNAQLRVALAANDIKPRKGYEKRS